MDKNTELKKLISIFIPTYNRDSSLQMVLDNVIKAVSKENICIYVYDNCSTDNTAQVVKNIQNKYENITYIKNEKNEGIDKNMLNVLNACDTKYTLMLGDDDYLLDDFCYKIQQYVEDDFDFIVLSSNTKYKTCTYTNKVEAFDFLWDKMPYGTLIIRNGIVEKKNMQKYIGSSHAYSAIPWEIMNSEQSLNKCLYYSECVLVNLGEIKKTWNSSAVDIFLYQIPLWFSLLPKVYKNKDKISNLYLDRMLSLWSLIRMKKNYKLSSLTNITFLSKWQKCKFLFFKWL